MRKTMILLAAVVLGVATASDDDRNLRGVTVKTKSSAVAVSGNHVQLPHSMNQRAPPPKAFKVGGEVWIDDLIRNDLQDPKEPRYPRLTVELYDYQYDVPGRPTVLLETVTTDEKGIYQFNPQVGSRAYRIKVQKPDGYRFVAEKLRPRARNSDVDDNGWTGPFGSGSVSGSRLFDFDAGLYCKIHLDFDDVPEGVTLPEDGYVSDEWTAYGLKLSARRGVGDKPRLFDTGNPIGDPDLAGNYGNVLIVQEDNDRPDIPDDNADGGVIRFDFRNKARQVFKMGLLDIDYETTVRVTYIDGLGLRRTRTIRVPLMGDNSFQEVEINKKNVEYIEVDFTRSGAVTFLDFCTFTNW